MVFCAKKFAAFLHNAVNFLAQIPDKFLSVIGRPSKG